MSQEITARVAAIASQLLTDKKVKLVIGYARPDSSRGAVPFFARTPEEAKKLVFDDTCHHNLVVYLTRTFQYIKDAPVAITVKGCDVKAINVLLSENQVKRSDVWVIGLPCSGVRLYGTDGGATGKKILDFRCERCEVQTPKFFDQMAGELPAGSPPPKAEDYADVADFDKKTNEEKFDSWSHDLERCVKCYACRAVCPLCYCERCVVDKNRPQWVKTSAHALGNFEWHVTRAMHLAGRCVGCGACETACHQQIPLMLLNRKLACHLQEAYGYRAGLSAEEPPALASWKPDDKQEFIG